MKQALLPLLGVASFFAATRSASAQDVTLTIATVDTIDMIRMRQLSGYFTAVHPTIALNWITLNERALRQRVFTGF